MVQPILKLFVVLFLSTTITAVSAAPPVLVCVSNNVTVPSTVTSAASVDALYCTCGAMIVDISAWTVPGTFFSFRNGSVVGSGYFIVWGVASVAAAAPLAPSVSITIAHNDLTNNGALKIIGTFAPGTRIDIFGNRVINSNCGHLGVGYGAVALIMLRVRLLAEASLLIRSNLLKTVKGSQPHMWTVMMHWVVAAGPNATVNIEDNTILADKTVSADNTAAMQTWSNDVYLSGSSNNEYPTGYHALAPDAAVRIRRNRFEILGPSPGSNTVIGVIIDRFSAQAPRSTFHFSENVIKVPVSVSYYGTYKFGLLVGAVFVSGCGAVMNVSNNEVTITSDTGLTAEGIVLSVNVADAALMSVERNRVDVSGSVATPLTIAAGPVASFGLLRVANNVLTAHHPAPTVPFLIINVALGGWGQVLIQGNAAVSAVVPTVTRPLLQGVLSGGGSPNDVQVIGNRWYGAAAVAGPAFSVSGTAVTRTNFSQTSPFFLRRHVCRNTRTVTASLTPTPSATATNTTPKTNTGSPDATITIPRTRATATTTGTRPHTVTPQETHGTPTVAATTTRAVPPTASHTPTAPATPTQAVPATLTFPDSPTRTLPPTPTHHSGRQTPSPSATLDATPTAYCQPTEYRAGSALLDLNQLEAGTTTIAFAVEIPRPLSDVSGPPLVPTWGGDADVVAVLAGIACQTAPETLVCSVQTSRDGTGVSGRALARLRDRPTTDPPAAEVTATIVVAGNDTYCEFGGQPVRAVVVLRVTVTGLGDASNAATTVLLAVLQRAVPAAIALAYVFVPTAVEPALVTMALEGPCGGPALQHFARLAVPIVNPFAVAAPDAAALLQSVLAVLLSLLGLAATAVAYHRVRRHFSPLSAPPLAAAAACTAARFNGSILWVCLVCVPGIALGTGLAVRAITSAVSGPASTTSAAVASAAIGAVMLVGIPSALTAALHRVPALRLLRFEADTGFPAPASTWLINLVTPSGRWAPAPTAKALGGVTLLLRAHLALISTLHILACAATAALVTAPPPSGSSSCAGRLATVAALLAGLGATAAILRPYRVPLHNALACTAGCVAAVAAAAAAGRAGTDEDAAGWTYAVAVATLLLSLLTLARAALAAWVWLVECRTPTWRHTSDDDQSAFALNTPLEQQQQHLL